LEVASGNSLNDPLTILACIKYFQMGQPDKIQGTGFATNNNRVTTF